jgi:hypothetical protein
MIAFMNSFLFIAASRLSLSDAAFRCQTQFGCGQTFEVGGKQRPKMTAAEWVFFRRIFSQSRRGAPDRKFCCL